MRRGAGGGRRWAGMVCTGVVFTGPGRWRGCWNQGGKLARDGVEPGGFCPAAGGLRAGGGFLAAGRARLLGRGVVAEFGEVAGLPEPQDLLQAGEDAGEDGGDQGVQGGGQNPGVSVGGGGGGAQAGEPVGQWDVCFHWAGY